MCRVMERESRPPSVISFAAACATRRVVFFSTPDVIFAKIFRAAETSTPVCANARGVVGRARRERERAGRKDEKKKNSQSNKAVSPSERLLAASGIKLQSHLEETRAFRHTTLRCNITRATPDDGARVERRRGSAAERRDWLLSSAPRTYARAHTKSMTMAAGKSFAHAHTSVYIKLSPRRPGICLVRPSTCLLLPSFLSVFLAFLEIERFRGFFPFFPLYFCRVVRDVAWTNPHRRVRSAESTDRRRRWNRTRFDVRFAESAAVDLAEPSEFTVIVRVCSRYVGMRRVRGERGPVGTLRPNVLMSAPPPFGADEWTGSREPFRRPSNGSTGSFFRTVRNSIIGKLLLHIPYAFTFRPWPSKMFRWANVAVMFWISYDSTSPVIISIYTAKNTQQSVSYVPVNYRIIVNRILR